VQSVGITPSARVLAVDGAVVEVVRLVAAPDVASATGGELEPVELQPPAAARTRQAAAATKRHIMRRG
jgi:hypothetical protein